MKERPILFSTDMVQAILEGRKSQTRRVIKPQPEKLIEYTRDCGIIRPVFEYSKDNTPDKKGWRTVAPLCPYGWPGDRLWVRETHMYVGKPLVEYIYKAGYPDNIHPAVENLPEISGIDWKPSIFMPKAAARIWLEITEVWVEKLQDINKEDAVAEGVQKITVSGTDHWKRYDGYQLLASSPVVSFWSLWAHINGEDAWEQNPWVWVVCFKVISTTGRPA